MVDIAVPRDIEPQVSELDDVYLYTVDDLREVIEENVRSRESAAREAEAMVAVGATEFMRQLRSLEAVGTVMAVRNQADKLRQQELDKAMKQLSNGKDPETVLANLARGLTNKLIHHPTVQLRQASAEGRTEMLDIAQQLFQLEEQRQED